MDGGVVECGAGRASAAMNDYSEAPLCAVIAAMVAYMFFRHTAYALDIALGILFL